MLIFQLHLPHAMMNSMQPFVYYISEGSVSISTCKFEMAAEVSTDTPKIILELEPSLWW